ncbi:isochorismatase family protein [Lophiostoma macrostomum CBS 122681]|uniref:Isochorismatase family protein n=1 Tax=Lophiostoma macrostomum CBS 122681 TaxID=1314788 RepID=A0A6A6SZS2_9PLEO|nr:isochorismatase family protein [Lophiostoma macrostomum CBS 122681]
MHRNSPGTSVIEAQPYPWPHDSSFNPQTSALIIIDMQKDFCCHGGYLDSQGISLEPTQSVIAPIRTLLHTFRKASFPVYHTREGHRADLSTLSSRELLRSRNNPSGRGIGDEGLLGRHLVRGEPGHDIIPELTPLSSEPVIDKPGRSAFLHTDLKLLLDNRGIRNLVICGVTTDVCVTSTMRDGNDMGLDCLLVSDATAAGEASLHKAAVETVCGEGGIFGAVSNVQTIITALESWIGRQE